MADLDLHRMMQQLAALARPELCKAVSETKADRIRVTLMCGLSLEHGGRHYDRSLKEFFDASR